MDLPDDLEIVHQPTRLRIMGLLYKHRDVAFTRVRDQLGLTDGNLASHADRLEDEGLLEARRALTPDGFEKRFRITEEGSRRFACYLETMQSFLEGVEPPRDPRAADAASRTAEVAGDDGELG